MSPDSTAAGPDDTSDLAPAFVQPCRNPYHRARRLMHGTLLAAIGIIVLLWTVVVLATVTERRTAIESARVEASNLSAAFAEQVRQVLRATASTMGLLEQRMRIEAGFNFDGFTV